MAYSNIVSAITKTVLEARLKVLEDVQAFVLSKVDEDSAEAIKEFFDDFRKEFNKTVEEESKLVKKGKGRAGAKNGEKRTRKPTPYNMFVSENMKRFKQENPKLNGKETMKMAMEAWSALSDEEKKAYREKVLSETESSEEDKKSEKVEEESEKESEEESEPEPEVKKKPAAKKGGKKGAK